jgi:hypothetical protein
LLPFSSAASPSRLLPKNVNIKIHRSIILPAVFYGCETSTLTLSEEHRLRVFEDRVPRRIFGTKREEIIIRWKIKCTMSFILVLFAEYNQNDRAKQYNMGKARSTHGEKRNAYKILVGNPEGKIPLGRPRRKSEDNIKMDF